MASEEVQTGARGSESLFGRGSSYISESIAELKKVTHPTRQETIQATMVTLLIIAVVAISLFVLDLILNRLMLALLS